jgi:hypothetical protein
MPAEENNEGELHDDGHAVKVVTLLSSDITVTVTISRVEVDGSEEVISSAVFTDKIDALIIASLLAEVKSMFPADIPA